MHATTSDSSDQAAIRRRNLSRILREVHVDGPVSRSDLSSRLGLNRSTVGSLVGELVGRGLVRERRHAGHSTPGRPSPLVEARQDGPVVLALDIATDSVGAAVVRIGGSVQGSARVERSREWRPPARVISQLAETARPLLDDLHSGQRLIGVGVAIPGIVRHADGFVHVAPNVGWRDVPLASLVRQELRVDVPVAVGNDAELATLAEHLRGAGVGRTDFICLWGEAGLGAGIVTGGVQLAGSAGYAGEVGHLPVNPAGVACRCGSRGCWETEVGEEALLRNAGLPASGGSGAGLDALFAAADRGVAEPRWAIETVGHWLGVGIAGLVDVFNPTGVALGGLYARLFPYVHQIIERELDDRAMEAPRRLVELMVAGLGPDSSLLGAAERALASTLDDPATMPLRQSVDSAA